MNFLLLSLAVFLMSIAAVHCRANRERLSKIKKWLYTYDPGVVYPAVLLVGGLLVLAASWVIY